MPHGPSFFGDLRANGKHDVLAGFLVFLIALPLCLGIAMASGFPPLSGILTAIVGGVIATFLGSARLTIKGPAAGLIVISLGAVTELGQGDGAVGYQRALAAIVVAGVLQVVLSLVRAGALGDLFPSSVVHGMLAAIGVIICSKQVHTLVGVTPAKGGPFALLAQLPRSLSNSNPEITLIGALSLLILFGMPMLPWPALRRVPGPLVVVVMAVSLGSLFDLSHAHQYTFWAHDYPVGPTFLLELPAHPLSAIFMPDYSAVWSGVSIKYIIMFALVGSIESLISTKAVDALDPLKRRSDLNRDLFATGVANVIAGSIGGLPMISEIVRSSANISSGARSRMANFFHGLFLLVFVAAVPFLLAKIPLAALAAMLVYTGTRLASPREFKKTWRIGPEQMFIFVSTLVVTLATDLLVGVFAGVLVKLILHVCAGMPLRNVFRPSIDVSRHGGTTVLKVGAAAVFTNYLTIKKCLASMPVDANKVVVDLEATRLVDHTVMEKLHELADEWRREGRELVVVGLEEHIHASAHPLCARRRKHLDVDPGIV